MPEDLNVQLWLLWICYRCSWWWHH